MPDSDSTPHILLITKDSLGKSCISSDFENADGAATTFHIPVSDNSYQIVLPAVSVQLAMAQEDPDTTIPDGRCPLHHNHAPCNIQKRWARSVGAVIQHAILCALQRAYCLLRSECRSYTEEECAGHHAVYHNTGCVICCSHA